ncbi:RcpC/CpaB family pilus assembly protein [Hamadaea sp. NPDC050747]|uniref:RcpC/CpaB family pilus assembly protein n=1 Tax=Hamadaea sp. NPDC050747 TaxID=3155789 RepID=UPI0033C41290
MTRRIIGVVLAIVLAVVGTAAVLVYVTSLKTTVEEGQKGVTVLVARARIPAGTSGTSIRSGGLTEEVVMPQSSLPDDVMINIGIEFDKLVVTSDVQPRQLLLKGMFGSQTKLSGGIAVPEKLMALSGKFEVEREVGGFVRPGSKIAVFSTCKVIDPAFKKKNETDRMATFVLLPKMEVLAVGAYGEDGQTSAQSADDRAKADAQGRVTLIVTIAASQQDAEKFVHATDLNCKLTLALLTDSSVVQVGGGIDNGTSLQ